MDFKSHSITDFKDVQVLTKDEAREEAASLREGILYHDYLYYVKNKPEISDATYDKLFHRLQEIEKAFPELQSETSPTRRVGAEPADELKDIRHASLMLSLNAVLAEKEFEDFDAFLARNANKKKIAYVLEPKFDGLSVEVVYENGKFKYGATRGDGKVGEDISKNLKTIHTVPLQLQDEKMSPPSFLSVRAEVFMHKDGFQNLNKKRIEKGQEPFANPRNAAAGTLRQLDPQKVAHKPLDVFFYDILNIEGNAFSSHWKALNQFSFWGLKTCPFNKRCFSLKKIKAYHQHYLKKRDELDYEIDGIVIKIDDYKIREELGVRHRSPRWALAWKFPPKEEVTELVDIIVQVGRTGILTPVALLEPLDVGGVTVSRATLHNEDEVHKKDVRPGDKVRIVRAGDVIPEVLERVKQPGKRRGKPFDMPVRCPACGSAVIKQGAYYVCPAGLSCPPQLSGRIVHYGSREGMGITGLGKKTAEALVEKGLVKNITDLYDLTTKEILIMDGFAKKSAAQLYNAIHKTKAPNLDRFLYALGIRHVGRRTALILAQEYGSLRSLEEASKNDLQEIPEIGSEIAESVVSFFDHEENRKVLEHLTKVGVKPQKISGAKRSWALKGKTFVFTGKLKNYTRQEAKRAVEDRGGRATSSVSNETDYLIVGKDPGSKLDEAKRHKIKILKEKRFSMLLKDEA